MKPMKEWRPASTVALRDREGVAMVAEDDRVLVVGIRRAPIGITGLKFTIAAIGKRYRNGL